MTTDDKAAATNDSGAKPATSTPTSNSAAAKPAVPPKPKAGSPSSEREPKKKRSWLGLLLFLLLLLLLAACAALGYYGWQWQQQQLSVQNELREQVEDLRGLKSLRGQVQQLEARESVDPAEWRQGLKAIEAIEQRVIQQSNRLQNMSTTSRNDWLLAEAEYLLRLANQRLLMERSSRGALDLLNAVDAILLQVDDVQLFGVRGQLARDIAALKLTPEVDRSGLFLRLSTLAQQVSALPTTPRLPSQEAEQAVTAEPEVTEAAEATEAAADYTGLWQKLQHNFAAAMKKLRDQVQIRRHEQPLEPLLPPDSEHYLRQNIRFNLEQAELALLREEGDIYRHSLQQAQALLQQHFPLQKSAKAIAEELKLLAQKDIRVHLPDINGSLQALQEFNGRLHKLNPDGSRPMLESSVNDGAAQP